MSQPCRYIASTQGMPLDPAHPSRRPRELPALRPLQRALRATTEWLARECACLNSGAPGAPGASAEWWLASAVATMHGIAPLLSFRPWHSAPPGWQPFLQAQRDHTAARHLRLIALLEQIDQQARRAGLVVQALKGAALHQLQIYTPGMRPMADIDLLIRPSDLERASQLVQLLGYRVLYDSRRERTFAPPQAATFNPLGEHRDNPVKIELHTRIAERLPVREVDITAALTLSAAEPGLHYYASLPPLMLHLLLHAAGNMRAHALRFVQLQDIAQLAPRLTDGDWERVLANRTTPRWWLHAPLTIVERYHGAAIPRWVMQQAASTCPAMLRYAADRHTLSDVSLSRLRMTFFAGFEWCRSAPDSLRFVTNRTWPSAQTRREMAEYVASHAWASRSDWYRASLPARAVHWVLRRPARVATLSLLHAARLAEPSLLAPE
jgi:hypothetical protein